MCGKPEEWSKLYRRKYTLQLQIAVVKFQLWQLDSVQHSVIAVKRLSLRGWTGHTTCNDNNINDRNNLSVSRSGRNLDVIFDDKLSMKQQVSQMC